ncbi:transketolase [Gracilibacillus halotolerans]|uniref:Transketolase n=1 Tax=Gracilibacillus halotolerans TaxID=74386 RepID=A0A841RRJ4_9BACI|nr:hypothetical protein [Gracilibacillus halotolerans]MBB6513835.1 transketolase [Gracilibacillus halotolerans]
MLTWIIVVLLTMLSVLFYLFTMLQENESDQEYLKRKLEIDQQEHEAREEEILRLKEVIQEQKMLMKEKIQAAKEYRQQIAEIQETLPGLESELNRWNSFELTEEEAMKQYKKWKKERV